MGELGAAPFQSALGPSAERFRDGRQRPLSLLVDLGGPLPGILDEDLFAEADGTLAPAPAAAVAAGVTPTLTPGGVSITASPAAAAAVGADPTLADGSLAIGVHGMDFQLFGHGNGPSSVTLSTTSGSMLLVFWGGASADLVTAPTDNLGNTFRRIGPIEEYPSFSAWSQCVYAAFNITGGATHTVECVCTDFEESTIFVVEVLGGKIVRTYGHTELPMGTPSTTHVGPNCTTAAAAINFGCWWGESNVGSDHTVSPSNSFAVIESYLIDHPDGYIQGALAYRATTSPGTYGTTYTVTPSQGFSAWGVVVEGALTADPAAATATGVTPSLAGDQGLTADPAAAAATGVTPALAGTNTITGSPAAATATGVDPTLTPGAATLTGAPAAAVAIGVAPTVTPGAVTTTAAPAAGAATAVAPTLAAGGVTAAPQPAAAAATGVDPSLAAGAVTLAPAPAAGAATSVAPSLVAGAQELVPGPAAATAAGATPALAAGAVTIGPSPADAAAVAVDPALQPGPLTLEPAAAAAAAAAVTPTLTNSTPAQVVDLSPRFRVSLVDAQLVASLASVRLVARLAPPAFVPAARLESDRLVASLVDTRLICSLEEG